jgi:arylsulfatase A-like enzyme
MTKLARRERPNILIFNPDQWRGDVLGHMGDPAAVTPNLDALARTDGVSFRNAFCQNPVCTPSRCSFMTGWYPHVRGHRTMFHMLHPELGEPNLLRTLKDNGYFVWWGGKNDLVPAQDGYDPYCHVKYRPPRPFAHDRVHDKDWRGEPGDDRYYSFYVGREDTGGAEHMNDFDWAMVEGAIEFIDQAPADQPLCIFLALQFPHPPYRVEEPWYSMIDRSKVPPRAPTPTDWSLKPSLLKGLHDIQGMGTWTEDRWNELRATYYGMCARVDEQFGRVCRSLRRAGLYDDTAIFVFSDHGDFAGDYGLVEKTQNTFEDCLSRVPFLVKPPGGVACRPGVRDALVELIDFPATVEALAGIQPRHAHFGRSLLPLIAGATDEHRDAVFCEGGRLRGERQAMEIESDPGLNPAGHYYPRMRLQRSDEAPYHTKATMCRTTRYKYVRRLYETDELYDLHDDPGEQCNRIHDPAMRTVLAQMKDRLLRWYQETADVVPFEIDRRW